MERQVFKLRNNGLIKLENYLKIQLKTNLFIRTENTRKQNKHLVDYQAGLRKKLIGWRNNFYRKELIEIRSTHKWIAFEDIDWAKLGKNKEVEYGDENVSKKNRGIAAVGKFREIAKQYFENEFLLVSACGTTCECIKCGFKNKKFKGDEFCCKGCGHREDRDFHSATQIRNRGICLVCDVI